MRVTVHQGAITVSWNDQGNFSDPINLAIENSNLTLNDEKSARDLYECLDFLYGRPNKLDQMTARRGRPSRAREGAPFANGHAEYSGTYMPVPIFRGLYLPTCPQRGRLLALLTGLLGPQSPAVVIHYRPGSPGERVVAQL